MSRFTQLYQSKYARLSLILTFGLSLAVVALSLIAQASSNSLVEFEFSSRTPDGKVNPYNQVLSWEFTRPVAASEQSRLQDLIRFSPEMTGDFRLLSNRIIFSPDQPLQYGTRYEAILDSRLKDIYSKELGSEYRLEFETKPQQFLYQTKTTTGYNLVLGTIASADSGAGSQSVVAENIASASRIREYIADQGGQMVVYTVQERDLGPSRVFIYTQGTGGVSELQLGRQLVISSLQFDRFGNLLFMGGMSDERIAELGDAVPEVTIKPYRYSFATNSLEELTALENHYGDILDFKVTPDGNSLLLHKYNYDMVIASLLDGSSVVLGRFTDFGGFSYSGERLALGEVNFSSVEFLPQVRIYEGSEFTFTTSEDMYSQDPELAPSGDALAYAERVGQVESSNGRFSVVINTLVNGEGQHDVDRTYRLGLDDRSFELPEFSGDARYLGLEVYQASTLASIQRDVRRYVNAGRPENSTLRIYHVEGDYSDPQLISEVENAYNLVWII